MTLAGLLSFIDITYKYFSKLSSFGKVGIILIYISFWAFSIIIPIIFSYYHFKKTGNLISSKIDKKECKTCYDKMKDNKTFAGLDEVVITLQDCRNTINRLPEHADIKELAEANIKLGLAVDFLLKHLKD